MNYDIMSVASLCRFTLELISTRASLAKISFHQYHLTEEMRLSFIELYNIVMESHHKTDTHTHTPEVQFNCSLEARDCTYMLR
jgi:hypothetical protein